MAVKLTFDDRQWLLKCYWKVENVVEVQRRRRVEFGIPPPRRVTITRIRDKFEVDGKVQNVLKGRCERKRSPTDNECWYSHAGFCTIPKDVIVAMFSWDWYRENPVFIEFWTCHQWYSISNNPDGMSLCWTSLLGVHCGRWWTFWTCTGLRKFKE